MQVSTEHLVLDENAVARIEGSRIKVMHVAIRARQGLTAEQIHEGYGHLSLSQIHAALAYYYDHQAAIDEQIKQSDAIADEYFSSHDQTAFVARLRERANKS
jgi:uncharacterized protein (DUF433 family)